jgi:hypothetical protein
MRRHFSFFPRLGTLLPATAAAAVMAAVLWPLREGPVFGVVALGAVIYAGIVYAVSPRSREVVLGRVR